MATYIPASRPAKPVSELPLTLAALQILVGGFIEFVELRSGDWLVVNEASHLAPLNTSATALAGIPVYGDVVLCEPSDIA